MNKRIAFFLVFCLTQVMLVGAINYLDYGVLWTYPVNSSFPTSYDLDGDSTPEIVFGSEDSYLYVLDARGRLLWKFKTNGSIVSSPVIGDLDGDSTPEIVFGSEDSNVYILSNGKLKRKLKTFGSIEIPPRIGGLDNRESNDVFVGSSDNVFYIIKDMDGIVLSYLTGGDILSTPEVADINKDGKAEIIFGSCDGRIYCLQYKEGRIEDGRQCMSEGCPMRYIIEHNLTEIWSFSNDGCFYSPVAVNLYGDKKLEIVVGSSDRNLYLLDSNGNPIMKYTVNGPVTIGPVIGDLDGDGKTEIIFGARNSIYIINYSGYSLWRYKTKGSIYSSPVVADLNSDNEFEIILGSDKLYVFGSIRDSDNDGIRDFYEGFQGLNPMMNDTDRDGFIDSDDPHPTLPESMFSDSDGDGLSDYEEIRNGFNPKKNDTDNDGLIDSIDPHPRIAESLFMDTDGDGLNDYYEIKIGTNPEKNDTDNDGLIDSIDPDPLKRMKSIDNNTSNFIEQNLYDEANKMANVSESRPKIKPKIRKDGLMIYIVILPILIIIYFSARNVRRYHHKSALKEKQLIAWEEKNALEMRRIVRDRL